MAEKYIEREALLNSICKKYCDCDYDGECPNCRLTEPIVAAPAADVAPVQHGRWLNNDIPDSILSKCSECGILYGSSAFNYCPNCGARMDGAE